MKERILELLRKSNYSDGEQDDDEMCATEIAELFKAVIAERMPKNKEIANEFPCNDGKTHVSKHDANRNFYRRQGAKWFRSRMKGEGE